LYYTSSYARYQLQLVPHRNPVSISESEIQPEPQDRMGDVVMPSSAASAWADAARRADPYFDFSTISTVFLVDQYTSRSYMVPDNVTLDGRTIKVGAVLGTDWGSHRHKLLAHEGGHLISLPDLYGGAGGHAYVGGWDLMGNLGGPSPDHFAWHKWKLGWLDDTQISCLATRNTTIQQTLTPVETEGGTKAIVVRYGDTRAYVAEVRTRNGLNSASCDVGVLVYSVDSAVSSASGPVRVRDARPGSGGCLGNELNDAAYDVGQAFVDSTNQVRIDVVSESGGNYVVRATFGQAGGGTVIYRDDFETVTGWQANPSGSDTATAGRLERGDPQATSFNGATYQQGTTPSGVYALVTGAAGGDVGTNDLDGGTTSIQSPAITLPSGATLTLSFQCYLAHLDNATSADYLRIRVVHSGGSTVVFSRTGSAVNTPATWQSGSANLTPYAGQTIRLVIEAADADTASLVEAGVDDVKITQA
jgi:M6 family metalloprotease-like protein